MDEDGQDEDRDGVEDVRGRQFSKISGTSEDEDGEDVDVLRRPALVMITFYMNRSSWNFEMQIT